MATTDQTIDWEAELPLHREWMLALARRRLGDSHASEDVVQEVLLSVVRQNPQLDDSTKVRSWLYQVVIRRVADHLRIRYRQPDSVGELTPTDEGSLQDGGWEWMLAKEQRHLLKVALGQLSDLERDIIMLKYTGNWSYQQLGERCGLSERAVEYRLVQAKQKLRKELQKLNGADHE
ncbi:MAG: RNA polymerase sigma factor [Planctomycetota bacterium]